MTGIKNRLDKRHNGYSIFLSFPKTVPCFDRDFFEWHNGISHYGFWAVIVNDLDWIELCDAAHAHIRQFVHPGYKRTPHITITACGLLDQNHFSTEQMERQWMALRKMTIPPFCLKVGSLNSFTAAPCLMIEDSTEVLKHIRDCLAVISEEDAPVQYQPHITLGLYRDAFSTVEVADCLARFKCASIKPMLVTELAFCVYETKDIQGQSRIMKRIKLEARQKPGSRNEKQKISLQGMRPGRD
jgi:2'-5' RNA ligase